MEQSCTYTEKHARDGDKDTSKEKHYYRLLVINVQSLTQFLLIRLGATTFIQKNRKRPPSKDESARQGP